MSVELQTEEAAPNDVVQSDLGAADTGTVNESGSELAADSGEGHEKQPDESVNQDAVQAVINKKHWEAKEAERKALAAEQNAKELQAKLDSLTAEQDPVVPDIPDPYDDDYELKVKARDEALLRKANFDAQQQYAQYQSQQAQQAQVQQQQQKNQEIMNEFSDRTTKLGLDKQEIAQAAQKLASYGMREDLASYVMQQEEGPLLMAHLSNNYQDLEKLHTLNPMDVGTFVSTVLAPKAASRKPKISQAPEPTDVLSGSGAAESTSPLLKGAKFE